MIQLRSVAFTLAFYAFTLFIGVFGMPLLLTERGSLWVARTWSHVSVWLLRVIAGTRLEVRGRENMPEGAFILACKHQSALETVALVTMVPIPTFILKRELMWMPFFGWFLNRSGMIPVNRGARAAALKAMSADTKAAVARGRHIIIFPEGTRRPVGAEPLYKWGVAHLYGSLKVPCVPAALNTGLFWPRNSFLRYPGTAVIELLPPIPPGLSKETFNNTLSAVIEEASNRLVAEELAKGPTRTSAPV
jgi:1-acyl-sn-glycerol-3-phosphate acyltransferase